MRLIELLRASAHLDWVKTASFWPWDELFVQICTVCIATGRLDYLLCSSCVRQTFFFFFPAGRGGRNAASSLFLLIAWGQNLKIYDENVLFRSPPSLCKYLSRYEKAVRILISAFGGKTGNETATTGFAFLPPWMQVLNNTTAHLITTSGPSSVFFFSCKLTQVRNGQLPFQSRSCVRGLIHYVFVILDNFHQTFYLVKQDFEALHFISNTCFPDEQ